MRLVYLPVSMAWVFVFGDNIETASIVPMDGWPRYFMRRADAVSAARSMGLEVDKRGNLSVTT